MPKFDTMNEISVPSLTDNELKALLAKANEEELMYALGYHKRTKELNMELTPDKLKELDNKSQEWLDTLTDNMLVDYLKHKEFTQRWDYAVERYVNSNEAFKVKRDHNAKRTLAKDRAIEIERLTIDANEKRLKYILHYDMVVLFVSKYAKHIGFTNTTEILDKMYSFLLDSYEDFDCSTDYEQITLYIQLLEFIKDTNQ